MKNLTRRDLVAALPALSLFGSVLAQAQTAATPVVSVNGGPDNLPDHCRVYNFDQLRTSTNPTGAITHAIMHGTLPTGEFVELHETTLGPGQMPHPPHRHVHSEWMLIREGTLEFQMGDRTEPVGPGGICYARSGETHGLKNIGSTPANYFVVAVGKEPA
jgi:mannose-6-phosphate isomerase-like protein (cupin superfamily)